MLRATLRPVIAQPGHTWLARTMQLPPVAGPRWRKRGLYRRVIGFDKPPGARRGSQATVVRLPVALPCPGSGNVLRWANSLAEKPSHRQFTVRGLR